MRYGRSNIGPQFGQKVAKLITAALTCGNRGDEPGFRRAMEEIYQMVDTVEQEAGAQFKEVPVAEEQVPTASVAAEVEPAPASEVPTKKASKGAGTTKRAGGKTPSAD